MSFKVPCGGFKLDEKLFSLDENGVLSIPKPLTYDYMPEGYPKKDGWSVEWDGNIDGKTSAIGQPLYKFSDRVLTYEEFLSATYVLYMGEEQHSGMVSEAEPKQTQLADAVSNFSCFHGGVQVVVVSEDNAGRDGVIFPTKGLYVNDRALPFKLIKETITPMSADFLPVVDDIIISSSTPDSTKKFKITVDDSGTLKATEVT